MNEGTLYIIHYYYPSGALINSYYVTDKYELYEVIDGCPCLLSTTDYDPDETLPHNIVCFDWMEQQRTR